MAEDDILFTIPPATIHLRSSDTPFRSFEEIRDAIANMLPNPQLRNLDKFPDRGIHVKPYFIMMASGKLKMSLIGVGKSNEDTNFTFPRRWLGTLWSCFMENVPNPTPSVTRISPDRKSRIQSEIDAYVHGTGGDRAWAIELVGQLAQFEDWVAGVEYFFEAHVYPELHTYGYGGVETRCDRSRIERYIDNRTIEQLQRHVAEDEGEGPSTPRMSRHSSVSSAVSPSSSGSRKNSVADLLHDKRKRSRVLGVDAAPSPSSSSPSAAPKGPTSDERASFDAQTGRTPAYAHLPSLGCRDDSWINAELFLSLCGIERTVPCVSPITACDFTSVVATPNCMFGMEVISATSSDDDEDDLWNPNSRWRNTPENGHLDSDQDTFLQTENPSPTILVFASSSTSTNAISPRGGHGLIAMKQVSPTARINVWEETRATAMVAQDEYLRPTSKITWAEIPVVKVQPKIVDFSKLCTH